MSYAREPVYAAENELRIFGPPGTGKTTELKARIEKACRARSPEQLLVASLTTTAAKNIAERAPAVPQDHIGTLHALCYRQLGSPPIAELKVEEWNESHPAWKLSEQDSTRQSFDEVSEQDGDTNADAVFSDYMMLRARCIPKSLYPDAVSRFAAAWEAWKRTNGYIDFTDMIEIVYHEFPNPPFGATLGVYDECQDYSALELALIRKWAKSMEYILLALDDDQTIFSFRGADPHAILAATLPEKNVTVLGQSYRLPRAVLDFSSRWIRRLSYRYPKDFRPRDMDGAVRRLRLSYRQVDPVADVIKKYLDQDRTVMLLASCGYMLVPSLMALRKAGIPFANTYRKKRGDWNPLAPRRGVSSVQRVLAYLSPMETGSVLWTANALNAWTDAVRSDGILQRGAKTAIANYAAQHQDAEAPYEQLERWFLPAALHAAAQCDPEWLYEHAVASAQPGLRYPINIVKWRGADALRESPKVTVGSIHSVKGGEASVVILFPDVSPAGYRQWMGPPTERDSVLRTFYVGLTRAKEALLLADPAGRYAVRWE